MTETRVNKDDPPSTSRAELHSMAMTMPKIQEKCPRTGERIIAVDPRQKYKNKSDHL